MGVAFRSDAFRFADLRAGRVRARGGPCVTLVPQDQELTTQEVAHILSVSRPNVVQLVESGKLPFRLVGTRRRVRFGDVLDFKQRDDEMRNKVADELAREAEKAGLQY